MFDAYEVKLNNLEIIMAHTFRFLGNPDKNNHKLWQLATSEIEHARKVLKIRVDDEIEVMNGTGTVGTGKVIESTKDAISVLVTDTKHFSRPQCSISLAIGALKSGDFDSVLADLIEIGVDEIHVFQQENTAKHRTSERSGERWERIILSAAKQSKRGWLPSLHVHDNLKHALDKLAVCKTKLVLDPLGKVSLLEVAPSIASSVGVVIGGEKGFSYGELEQCQMASFTSTKLGGSILRATTAAVAVAAVLIMSRKE